MNFFNQTLEKVKSNAAKLVDEGKHLLEEVDVNAENLMSKAGDSFARGLTGGDEEEETLEEEADGWDEDEDIDDHDATQTKQEEEDNAWGADDWAEENTARDDQTQEGEEGEENEGDDYDDDEEEQEESNPWGFFKTENKGGDAGKKIFGFVSDFNKMIVKNFEEVQAEEHANEDGEDEIGTNGEEEEEETPEEVDDDGEEEQEQEQKSERNMFGFVNQFNNMMGTDTHKTYISEINSLRQMVEDLEGQVQLMTEEKKHLADRIRSTEQASASPLSGTDSERLPQVEGKEIPLLREMESKVRELEDREAEMKEEIGILKSERDGLIKMKSKIDELELFATMKEEEIENQRTEYERRISDQDEVLSKLRSELEAKSSSVEDDGPSVLELVAQLQGANDKIEEQQQALLEMTAKLEELGSSEMKLEDVSAHNETLKSRLVELEESFELAQSNLARHDEVKAELASAYSELESLRSESESKLREQSNEKESLLAKIGELEESLSASLTSMSEMERIKQELAIAHDKIQVLSADREGTEAAIQSERESLALGNEKLHGDVARLSEELKEEQERSKSLKERLDETLGKLSEEEASKIEMRIALDTLRNESELTMNDRGTALANAVAQLEESNAEQLRLRQELVEHEREKLDLQEQIDGLSEKLSALRGTKEELTDLRERFENLQTKSAEEAVSINQEKDELLNRIDALEQELGESHEVKRRLGNTLDSIDCQRREEGSTPHFVDGDMPHGEALIARIEMLAEERLDILRAARQAKLDADAGEEAVSNANSANEQIIVDLKRQVAENLARVEELVTQLETLRGEKERDTESFENVILEKEESIARLNVDMGHLSERNATLESSSDYLEETIQQMQRSSEESQVEFEKDLLTMKETIRALEDQVAETSIEFDRLERQLQAVEHVKQELEVNLRREQQLADEQTIVIGDLEQRLNRSGSTVDSEDDDDIDERSAFGEDFESPAQRVSNIREQLDNALAEKEQLEDRLAALQNELSDAKREVSFITNSQTASREESTRMEADMESLKQSLATLEKEKTQYLEEKEAIAQKLDDNIDLVRNLEDEKSVLESRIEEVELQLKADETRVASQMGSLAAERETLEGKISSLSLELEEARSRFDNLQSTGESEFQEYRAVSEEKSQAQLAEIERLNDELRVVRDSIGEKELALSEAATARTESENLLNEVQAELVKKSSRLGEVEKILEERDAQIQDLERGLEHAQQSEEALNALRAEFESSEAQSQERSAQQETLATKLEESMKAAAETREELESLRSELTNKDNSLADAVTRQGEAENVEKELRATIERLHAEKLVLEEDLSGTMEAMAKSRAEVEIANGQAMEDLQSEISAKTEKIEELASRNEELVQRLEDIAAKAKSLEDELLQIQSSHSDGLSELTAELESSRVKLSEKVDELSALTFQNDKLSAELEEKATKNADLEAKLLNLSEEIEREKAHAIVREKELSEQDSAALDEVRTMLDDAQIQLNERVEKIRELTIAYERSIEDCTSLQEELDTVKAASAEQVASLENTIQQMKEEAQEDKNAVYAEMNMETAQLQAGISELKSKLNAEVLEKEEAIRAAESSALERLRELETSHRELLAQKEEVWKAELSSLEASKKEMEEIVESLKVELEEQKETHSTATKDLDLAWTEKLAQLQSEMEGRLELEVKKASEEAALVLAEKDKMEAVESDLNKYKKRAQAAIKSSQSKIKVKDEQIKALSEQLAAAQNKLLEMEEISLQNPIDRSEESRRVREEDPVAQSPMSPTVVEAPQAPSIITRSASVQVTEEEFPDTITAITALEDKLVALEVEKRNLERSLEHAHTESSSQRFKLEALSSQFQEKTDSLQQECSRLRQELDRKEQAQYQADNFQEEDEEAFVLEMGNLNGSTKQKSSPKPGPAFPPEPLKRKSVNSANALSGPLQQQLSGVGISSMEASNAAHSRALVKSPIQLLHPSMLRRREVMFSLFYIALLHLVVLNLYMGCSSKVGEAVSLAQGG